MEHLGCNDKSSSRALSSSLALSADLPGPQSEKSSSDPSLASVRPASSLLRVLRVDEAPSVSSVCEARSDGWESNKWLAIDACVTVLGDSGSGRTSLATAVAGVASRLRCSSEHQSAYSGSLTTYVYRRSMSRRKECLRFGVIDTGPLPARGGACRLFLPCSDTVIIAFALTSIKQGSLHKRRFFSLIGNSRENRDEASSVIVHPKDRGLLCGLLAMVTARLSLGGHQPGILLVGTHMDLLSDPSRSCVERVLLELRSICSNYLKLLSSPLSLHSVFAVSVVDGTCVSENRGGPCTLTAFWSFVCDVMLKRATARRSLSGCEPMSSVAMCHNRLSTHSSVELSHRSSVVGEVCSETDRVVDDVENGGCRINLFSVPVVDCALDDVNAKVVRLIIRVKADRKIVFVYFSTLWGLMYASGLPCKRQLKSILQQLRRAGEIFLFDHRPQCLPVRGMCICLHPQLVERAQSAIFVYSRFAREFSAQHGRLLANVNLEECGRCDPNRDALRGVFPYSLVCKLAPSLNLDRSPSEATENFVKLLLLSDTAFIRRRRDSLMVESAADIPSLSPQTGIDRMSGTFVSSVGSLDCGANMESLDGRASTSGTLSAAREQAALVEFVVPSLIQTECPIEVVNCVRRLAAAWGETKTEPRSYVFSRVLGLRGCPPDFFSMLASRLQRYICPSAPIFFQALWLGDLAVAGDSACPPRMFIHLWSDGWTGSMVPHSPENAVSLLELHAFSDISYLTLLLFVDKVTCHIKKLIWHEFPGMFTWVPEISCPRSDISVEEHLCSGMSRGTERLSEVTTLKDLDDFFRTLDG